MEANGRNKLHVKPYHTTIPTFGSWGFVLASWEPMQLNQMYLPQKTKYLSPKLMPTLFEFPRDMQRLEVPVNNLNDPVIVELYTRGYHRYFD